MGQSLKRGRRRQSRHERLVPLLVEIGAEAVLVQVETWGIFPNIFWYNVNYIKRIAYFLLFYELFGLTNCKNRDSG